MNDRPKRCKTLRNRHQKPEAEPATKPLPPRARTFRTKERLGPGPSARRSLQFSKSTETSRRKTFRPAAARGYGKAPCQSDARNGAGKTADTPGPPKRTRKAVLGKSSRFPNGTPLAADIQSPERSGKSLCGLCRPITRNSRADGCRRSCSYRPRNPLYGPNLRAVSMRRKEWRVEPLRPRFPPGSTPCSNVLLTVLAR